VESEPRGSARERVGRDHETVRGVPFAQALDKLSDSTPIGEADRPVALVSDFGLHAPSFGWPDDPYETLSCSGRSAG